MLNENIKQYSNSLPNCLLREHLSYINYICKMKTVIIGSGNVAFHICKAFQMHGIPVSQVFGRNPEALKELGEELGINVSDSKLADADLYIIAVSDSAVAKVSAEIIKEDCLVAHTSGSLEKQVLQGNYRKASFYPMQTFSRNRNLDYSRIPFLIEASNGQDQMLLENLARKISPNVSASTFEKRKYMHLTAVFACNFVNHLFARAKEISDKNEVPFSYFQPLIDETVEKLKHLDPKDAQTGPAVRNDTRVLEMHRQMLGGTHLEIYNLMNESIRKMYEL